VATAAIASDNRQPASATPNAQETISSGDGTNAERLRDYVGAFVLAGLDPHVGSETEFFADRVEYYDEGVIGREKSAKIYSVTLHTGRTGVSGSTARSRSSRRAGIGCGSRFHSVTICAMARSIRLERSTKCLC
jgi:hypothetical protein